MREIRYLPEVFDDIISTSDWLDAKRVGLSDEFQSEFFASVQRAVDNPNAFSTDHTGYRPVRLKRFSAVMYFTIENDFIVIAGVFMGGRSEKHLRDR